MILNFIAWVSLTLLLGTWVIYPLVIWVLGWGRRPARVALPPQTPAVSIVIATRESTAAIRARVENCFETRYPREQLEVVVSLDRSPSPTDAELEGIAAGRVRLVAGGAVRGKAAALNAGVASAGGEVLVFADTFQRFDAETVPALVAPLSAADVGAVTGALQIPQGRALLARSYWRYELWLRGREARVHSTVGATGAVYALRRALWQPLRPGVLLDDVFTPMQVVLAGYRVAFAENARAVELRSSAPVQEYHRKVRTLTGVIQICVWLPAILSPLRNPVWAQFVCHKLLRLLTPYSLVGIGVWAATAAAAGRPAQASLFAAGGLLAGVWVSVSRSRRAARLRDLLVEGMLLQMAIVMAGVNGVRRRWEVWHG